MTALLSHHLPSRSFAHVHGVPVLNLARLSYSTTSQSRFLYRPLEDVERLEYYRPGGYHPVQIGDSFHGRYQIVHKLGHGTFSTIWLARDERLSKYVAIKVCTADTSQHEIDTLSRLNNGALQKAAGGEALTPIILDRFNVQGPNGTHLFFTTAPARCSLVDTKEASVCRLFRLDVARSLAAQLTLAIAHTHERGVVHGGEFATSRP